MNYLKTIFANRKVTITSLIIAFCVIVFIIPMFPIIYPTDIYCIEMSTFKEYAFEWFLPSGRIMGFIFFNILDFFNISVNCYIIISKIFTILIATSCIYIFYNLLLDYGSSGFSKNKNFALLFSIMLFLNHSTFQLFYYTESCIMWLGILFTILAVKTHFSDVNHKILKTILLLFLAVNCYQPVIFIYVPILLALFIDNKKELKDILLVTIKNCLIIMSLVLFTYLLSCFVRIDMKEVNPNPITFTLDYVVLIKNLKILLLDYFDSFPNLFIWLINLYFLLFSIIYNYKNSSIKEKSNMIIAQVLVVVINFFEVFLTISLTNFYMADRIQIAYLLSNIIVILVILNNTNIIQVFYKQITTISVLIVLLNFANVHNLIMNHNKALKIDKEIVNIINNTISNYEKLSNNEITTIKWCFDGNTVLCYGNTRYCNEITYRHIGSWCTKYSIPYYFGENRTVVYDEQIFIDVFNEAGWDEFSEDQIKFSGDTMYYCVF